MNNVMSLLILMTGVLWTPVICQGAEDLVPVYGEDVEDGTYQIEVTSSSSMFRIVDAQLKVAGGDMTAVLTLSGTGYLKLFMGTGEEAMEAGEDTYIPFVENEEGAYTYTVPVAVLNQEIDCAAYSKRKEKWYDRKLVFLAAALPEDALKIELPTQAQDTEAEAVTESSSEDISPAKTENPDLSPVEMSVKDGDYTMELTLTGGSGKATVVSPAAIRVTDARATAQIEWSSPNYDYMIVNGQTYLPVNEEGNSVFEIPLLALDQAVDVIADTVAMSKPHEIAYTLTFHSDTLKSGKDRNVTVVIIGTVVVLVVLVAVPVVSRTRKKKVQNA
ncbi:MAG: hypothetical protein IJ801_04720 [Lachnospiraceae bacterium]|nr:hypothetical protein [Lachnospiraceae bacterium]